jgi:hypothetical protein
MSSQPHAARVFIVLDPVQDYEESDDIWGVFGSLAAAQVGTRLLRARHYTDELSFENEQRDTHVELWEGTVNVQRWEFSAQSRRWREIAPRHSAGVVGQEGEKR